MTLYRETSHEYYGSRAAQRSKRTHAFRPLGINTGPTFPSFDRPDPKVCLVEPSANLPTCLLTLSPDQIPSLRFYIPTKPNPNSPPNKMCEHEM